MFIDFKYKIEFPKLILAIFEYNMRNNSNSSVHSLPHIIRFTRNGKSSCLIDKLRQNEVSAVEIMCFLFMGRSVFTPQIVSMRFHRLAQHSHKTKKKNRTIMSTFRI